MTQLKIESISVFCISNTATGEKYFGSSINPKATYQRYLRHLRRNTFHNNKMQESYNKCGEHVFELNILEDHLVTDYADRKKWVNKHIKTVSSRKCYNCKMVLYKKNRSIKGFLNKVLK